MSDPNHKHTEPPIIIKKIIKKAAHHGGAWKIAYADFVTAMMAFFLLMWLLSMLNKFQLMGISNYFKKPLKDVFVENQKNDTEAKKIPDEQTKKFKLVMTSDEVAALDPKSRGSVEKNSSEQSKVAKYVKHSELEAKMKSDMVALKNKLEQDLENTKELKKYKEHLKFEVTKDGLKVNLRDLENRPMFSLGKEDFQPYADPVLKWLAAELNQDPRKLMIIGHTDAHKYPNEDRAFSNWELSSERANATRRQLIKHGMSEEKMLRVEGASDSNLLDKKHPYAAQNRRIEIIILNEQATKNLSGDISSDEKE